MQVINAAALLVSLYLLVQLSLGSGPPMSPQDSGDIGRPIDWTTGQLKNPVFTFTNCSQLIPGTNLTQPCESIIYITPFTAIGNLTYTVFTVSDYQTVIVETMQESEGLWGSQDFSYVEWMSGYIEDDYSFSVCHATWSLFEAVLSDIKSIALWESFQKDLNTVYKLLDGKYSYDILYKEIILKYGTHVPIRANYGGSIKYVSMLMNCIARMYSQTWVTEQTQAVFDLAVDGYSYTQVSSYMYDASVCSSQWLFLGGPTIEYPSPPAVSEWVSDLGQNPVYLGFGGDWAMLSAIVPANYTGLPEMVANAIQQYINNAQVTQPTMTEYIFPYISPPDYAGMGCEGSCTQGCWGQIACEGQSCIYPGPVTVSKIHDAPCGYDDDDCDHENNCVVNLDAEGYCGLFSTDCHRVCFAPYYSTLATQVPCQSAAQCYPYS